MPDAPSAAAYWQNIVNKRYSITEVPPERWSAALYYDPDPKAPDKTYSKIGGWVRNFEFDWKRFRIPPKVAAAMDEGQQWAVTVCADALADYGYPQRPLNTERTAVILGTAMGGELHYVTNQRIAFPEFVTRLETVPEFRQLPTATRTAIIDHWHENVAQEFPPITEDSMPGELPNIVSGRVANVLNLRGPNFITDAACASSFAAVESACELLFEHKVDAALTGGVDRNMGISSFVKFCKIGALSATGTRPFGDGADGFVMGEGTGVFLLKRLADAERAGDKIYAVIRGVGGASDGKGKGITAPNPIGQQLAVKRAWESAGLDPVTATLVEGHGTSTRVGDVVEVESLTHIFGAAPRNSIGLGSAKSNIGHLKAGAGAAGMLKAVMALHHKILPPTLNAGNPNPHIDFSNSPFYLVHEPREWKKVNGTPRRCGVSAYGFGGTNFHLVLEEHVPGRLTGENKNTEVQRRREGERTTLPEKPPLPVRGILAIVAHNPTELKEKLDRTLNRVRTGWTPPVALLETAVIQSPERLIIDFGSHDELLDRIRKAQKVMGFDNDKTWKAVQAQGIFRGRGKPNAKIAFLFPGQGSQYPNMGRELAEKYPIVAAVFADADKIMTPILGKPLTDTIFVDPNDQAAMMQAQLDLMQTEITQPAMLTMDIAMLKLLDQFGFTPDMVMGHSLGEYAALIAAGIMPFAHALEAAAARGSEMSKVSMDDNGWMAAVLAPYDIIIETLNEIDGYVVPANINSRSQCVIGGAGKAVEQAIRVFQDKGYRAMQLPVSHAFHTQIVAPASAPLRQVLDRLDIQPPKLPLVANLTGEFYPTDVEAIKDILQQQVASPVQWVKGLETLYNANARTFVEVGPKRALRGFANDVFADHEDVLALMTNHPKTGELPAFNQALCGLYAAGYGGGRLSVNGNQLEVGSEKVEVRSEKWEVGSEKLEVGSESLAKETPMEPEQNGAGLPNNMEALGQILMQVLQQTANNQQLTINNQPLTIDTPADEIANKVLTIVAEATGYPTDMLELDLDLEADLGIDTVKQAETFAAIRNKFDIPRRDDLNLRDYPTLEHVIGYVQEMRSDLVVSQQSIVVSQEEEVNSQQSAISSPQSAVISPSPLLPISSAQFEFADKMPRRVPVPMLRPSLDWCKPTGIVLDENSRVVVALDSGGVGKSLINRLGKRGVTALTLDTALDADALTRLINTWLAEGPIQGVYWLPALDVEPDLEEMTLDTWREANRIRVKSLSIVMRTLYDVVSEAGNFLITATRLGGLHGYGPNGASAPLGGAVTGFTKAYKRERGDVLVKAVDFEAGRKTAVPAAALIAETLTDPGIVEAGYFQDHRYTVTLTEQPAADGKAGLTLNENTVFVVTGAAGGITSAIVSDLAAAGGGIFYLLDLVAAPAADDQKVMLFRSDKNALKQQLIAAAKAAGERPTPVLIDKQMMGIERQEAALQAIETVAAAGGTAVYRSLNLLDGPAVTAVVDEIRRKYGRIDVLIHAGGIEISKALNEKEAGQFDTVFDIKADGFFSLLNAAKEMPIGATVSFSSVAGRFGNSGQTDYSAANDLLCKLTSSLRNRRPDTKGIVIDWTAWDGIGMATRGSIPKIMEMAGIEMLPPESGIPTVRRELVAGGFKGEIAVGGALGMLVAKWDETGGLDVDKVNAWLNGQNLLMVGKVTAANLYGGVAVETTLDPTTQPFLFDHAPDEGTPWLPGVMATEALAEVATVLAPGYHVVAVENEVMSGAFKFFRNEPRTLYLTATTQPGDDGELVAHVTLRSITKPAREGLPVREQQHFAADIRLQPEPVAQPAISFTPPAADTLPVTAETVYRSFFHGPAYQVIERAGIEKNRAICLMPPDLPPNTSPADALSLTAPRLVELCFQAAALWTQEVKQAMGFPLGIGSVTAYRQPPAANGRRLYALLETPDDGETFDAQVVDEAGNVYVDLKGYRTISRPM